MPQVARTLLGLVMVAACAVLTPSPPLRPSSITPHPQDAEQIAREVAVADGVVVGAVWRTREEADFETVCGVLEKIRGCRDQDAWSFTVKTGQGDREVWGFPPPGQYLPIAKGLQAVFLVQRTLIEPFAKCRGLGQFQNACLETGAIYVLQVVDTLDILPLSDTAAVAALFRERAR